MSNRYDIFAVRKENFWALHSELRSHFHQLSDQFIDALKPEVADFFDDVVNFYGKVDDAWGVRLQLFDADDGWYYIRVLEAGYACTNLLSDKNSLMVSRYGVKYYHYQDSTDLNKMDKYCKKWLPKFVDTYIKNVWYFIVDLLSSHYMIQRHWANMYGRTENVKYLKTKLENVKLEDSEIEELSMQCGWEPKRRDYMTDIDWKTWLGRMRKFAELVVEKKWERLFE